MDLILNVFGLDKFYIVMLFSHDYWFNSETRISTISLFEKDSGRIQSIDGVSQIKPKLGVTVLKNINKILFSIFLIIKPFYLFSIEKDPTVQLRLLNSQIVHQIVSAAVEHCTQKGYLVSAAVVDRNGNLVAFLRNPLSSPHTIKVSQRKAFSSASLRTKTSEIANRRSDLNYAPDILLIVGGVPIQFNGIFYGGVAVAGAPPEIDEKCAQAGIDEVSEIMEFAD